MKKRNNRKTDYKTMSKKILCGKFATTMLTNFAVGDQDYNLLLYNTLTPKPIAVLNPQINSNVSSCTSLTFTGGDDQIVVGSSRGSINVWDLSTLKIGYCLKGHTIQVSCLASDSKEPYLLASGSCDTVVKLWDLRSKNYVANLKNHSKKVTAIGMTLETRLLISGGEDGKLHAYDIRMGRPLFDYDLYSPILSLDCHPKRYLIAAGCLDRMTRLLEYTNTGFNLYGNTKSETMPISHCAFHKDHLFTTGNDNLKLWDLNNEIQMTDNIESGSKGILSMVISENEKIQQIAYSGGSLSYHECILSQVNFKGMYVYNQSMNVEKQWEEIQKNTSKLKRGNTFNVSAIQQITNQKAKAVVSKRNNTISRQLKGINQNINDALSNVKLVSQNFSNRKNEEKQLQKLMEDEHNKFIKVMANRAKNIQKAMDLWMKGNVKLVMQMLKEMQIYACGDVLKIVMKPGKLQLSAQFGVIVAQRTKEMIMGKHLTIIKTGLEYMLQIVGLFKDDMVKLKVFGMDKGVDLARQERLRRYDMLIEAYVEIYQSHRLKKLIDKKDQSSNLAEQLMGEYKLIFKRVFGNQYDL